MKFYLIAKALKNEVALDFLENLKMGERVIQEIKNKEKFSRVSSFPVFFVLVSLKFPFNINFRAFVAITAHNFC
jgi:hypothetical protein